MKSEDISLLNYVPIIIIISRKITSRCHYINGHISHWFTWIFPIRLV